MQNQGSLLCPLSKQGRHIQTLFGRQFLIHPAQRVFPLLQFDGGNMNSLDTHRQLFQALAEHSCHNWPCIGHDYADRSCA